MHHAGGQLGPPAQAAPATAAQVEELAGHVEELAGQVAKLKNMVMDLAGDMKVMSAQITNIRARAQNAVKLRAGAALMPLVKEKQPAAGGARVGTMPPRGLFPPNQVALQKVCGGGCAII